jgi:hypothetical protein
MFARSHFTQTAIYIAGPESAMICRARGHMPAADTEIQRLTIVPTDESVAIFVL